MNEKYEYLDKNKWKKIEKIRKNLGNDFHLGMKVDLDNEENWYITEWKLFEEYDNPEVYFSKDNTPLMDSESNTLDELYDFSKKVKKYDEMPIKATINIIMIIIVCITTSYLRINYNMKEFYIIGYIAYAVIILNELVDFFLSMKKLHSRHSKIIMRKTRLIRERAKHE